MSSATILRRFMNGGPHKLPGTRDWLEQRSERCLRSIAPQVIHNFFELQKQQTFARCIALPFATRNANPIIGFLLGDSLPTQCTIGVTWRVRAGRGSSTALDPPAPGGTSSALPHGALLGLRALIADGPALGQCRADHQLHLMEQHQRQDHGADSL